jgi:hypothetical protein
VLVVAVPFFVDRLLRPRFRAESRRIARGFSLESHTENSPKIGKKLLIPGTAVLYFAKVCVVVNIFGFGEIAMTPATKHRPQWFLGADSIELLVPE